VERDGVWEAGREGICRACQKRHHTILEQCMHLEVMFNPARVRRTQDLGACWPFAAETERNEGRSWIPRRLQWCSHSLVQAAAGVARHWPVGQAGGAARRGTGMCVKLTGGTRVAMASMLAISQLGARAWQMGGHAATRGSTAVGTGPPDE